MSATFVSIFSDDELAPELSVICDDMKMSSLLFPGHILSWYSLYIQGGHKKLLQTAVQINKVRINFFDIFQRILLG